MRFEAGIRAQVGALAASRVSVSYPTRSYLQGPMEDLEPRTVGCVVVGDGREVCGCRRNRSPRMPYAAHHFTFRARASQPDGPMLLTESPKA